MDFDTFVLKTAKLLVRGIYTDEDAKAICQCESVEHERSFDEIWGLVQSKMVELS